MSNDNQHSATMNINDFWDMVNKAVASMNNQANQKATQEATNMNPYDSLYDYPHSNKDDLSDYENDLIDSFFNDIPNFLATYDDDDIDDFGNNTVYIENITININFPER